MATQARRLIKRRGAGVKTHIPQRLTCLTLMWAAWDSGYEFHIDKKHCVYIPVDEINVVIFITTDGRCLTIQHGRGEYNKGLQIRWARSIEMMCTRCIAMLPEAVTALRNYNIKLRKTKGIYYDPETWAARKAMYGLPVTTDSAAKCIRWGVYFSVEQEGFLFRVNEDDVALARCIENAIICYDNKNKYTALYTDTQLPVLNWDGSTDGPWELYERVVK